MTNAATENGENKVLRELQRQTVVLTKQVAAYKELLASTPVCINKIRLGPQGFDIVWTNEAMYKLIKYTEAEYRQIFAGHMDKYFAGSYAGELERLKASIEEAVRLGRPHVNLLMKVPTKTGFCWVNGSGTLTDYDRLTGRPAFCYAIYTDATPVVVMQEQATAAAEAKHREIVLKEKNIQLDHQQRLYEAAIRSADLVLWEYDIEKHRITLSLDNATERWRQLFGVARVYNNVPASLVDFIDAKDVPAFLKMYQDVEKGQDASCEVWFKEQVGRQPRCVQMSYWVKTNPEGKPVIAYGIGRNITAEKKVAERYERELENLRHYQAANLIGKSHSNLTKNKVLEYTPYSEAACPIISGEDYDFACVKLLQQVYGSRDIPKVEQTFKRTQLIRRYQEGQMHDRIEYRRSLPGKNAVWVRTEIHIYMMPETGDLECFTYTYDITALALQTQIIAKMHALGYIELGLVSASKDYWQCYRFDPDRDGKMQVQSRSGAYGKEIERFLKEEVPKEDWIKVEKQVCLETIKARLDNKEVYSTSCSLPDEQGNIRQILFRFMYQDPAQDDIFYCMSDITQETLEDRRQIVALKAAKYAANKANQAKSNFLSSMSHDLRTPLNGIIGFTEIALRESRMDLKEEYLHKIATSGKLLLDLVNDTLELSRIESGKLVLKPEPVDGKNFWESVVTALIPAAEMKGVHLHTDSGIYPTEMILVDQLKVKKVLLNLISNAIKYTPAGGHVEVSVEALNPPQNGFTRRIIVQDDGIGMHADFLTRMYEPFAQEHRPEAQNVTGTGLGLAIVKRIVDIMYGRIEVVSKPHVGTRFTVYLPIEHWEKHTAELKKQQEIDYARAEAAAFAGRKVLLCEDNYMNAEIAMLLLKDKKMQVDWVKDGTEGVAKFRDSLPGYYDLVLMDLRMPKMDGYEAAKAIRILDRPDAKLVPIVAMTADAFEEDMKNAATAGMNGYITKPIDTQHLYDTLFAVLAHKLGSR